MEMFYLNLSSTMCDRMSQERRDLKAYAKLEGISFYNLVKRKKKKK